MPFFPFFCSFLCSHYPFYIYLFDLPLHVASLHCLSCCAPHFPFGMVALLVTLCPEPLCRAVGFVSHHTDVSSDISVWTAAPPGQWRADRAGSSLVARTELLEGEILSSYGSCLLIFLAPSRSCWDCKTKRLNHFSCSYT